MNNNGQYSIKLANGAEQTFNSAVEMAAWLAEQNEQIRPRHKSAQASKRQRTRIKKRKVRCYSGDSPLARYANRNSDET